MVINSVSFRYGPLVDLKITVKPSVSHEDDDTFDLCISHKVRDRDTGKAVAIYSVCTVFLPEMAQEVVERIRNTVKTLVTHEIDESLHVGGARIFDPHIR